MLCALAGLATPSTSRILFAGDSPVPRAVQEFAWRVIETRCNYQSYEREQRSFWAFDAQARHVDQGVVYSINILSEVSWKKREPPAITALKSSFVVCAYRPG